MKHRNIAVSRLETLLNFIETKDLREGMLLSWGEGTMMLRVRRLPLGQVK
jgi:hypothetical protein